MIKQPRNRPAAIAPAQPEATPPRQDAAQERLERIARAAYFKAEARGFAPGAELDDWLAAEAEHGAVP